MSISQSLRFQVLERDGFTCQYCGRKVPQVELEVDHILPVTAGGSDSLDNLWAACIDCNTGKAGKIISKGQDNEALTERIKFLQNRRSALRKINSLADECIEERERLLWILVDRWQGPRGERPETGKDASCSWELISWLRGAMTRHSPEEILDAIDITMQVNRDTNETRAIKYFCAVLRNRKQAERDGADE